MSESVRERVVVRRVPESTRACVEKDGDRLSERASCSSSGTGTSASLCWVGKTEAEGEIDR